MPLVTVDDLSRDARALDIEDFFHGFGRLEDVNIRNGFAVVEFADFRDADDAVRRLDGRRLCGGRVNVRHRDNRGGGGFRDRRDDRYDDRRGGGGGYGRDRYDDRRGGYEDRRGGGDRYGGPPRDRRGGGARGKVERTKFGIVCKNLSTKANWMDLKDLARKYGECTYTDANKAVERQGIMTFATRKDMVTAFEELQGKDLFGRPLELEYEDDTVLDENWEGDVNNDHPNSNRGGGGDRRRERSRSPPGNDRYNRSRSRSRSYSR